MRKRSLGLALLTSAALVVPATAVATPQGQGLFPHDTDSCVPSVGSTEMLLTGGRSMWIGDGHYLIHDYTNDGVAGFGHGQMSGLADRGTTTCTGTLGGGTVVSTDYLVK